MSSMMMVAAQAVVQEMPESFKNKIEEMGDSNIVQARHSEIIDAIDSPEEDEICLDRSQLMENVKLI